MGQSLYFDWTSDEEEAELEGKTDENHDQQDQPSGLDYF